MQLYHRATLNNGVSLSIQAHYGAYCQPRKDDAVSYTEVEIGFPSEEIELINEYKEIPGSSYKKAVYPYVPVEKVRQVIESAGGLKTLSPIPPGILTREDYAEVYKRCSERIPLFYRASWLERKTELQKTGIDFTPHKWCFEIYTFMDDALIKDALRHWAEFRIDEMDEWGVDDQPNDEDTYEHYKKSIKGWDEGYSLEERLALIKKQLNEDINLKFSHEDWLMDRD